MARSSLQILNSVNSNWFHNLPILKQEEESTQMKHWYWFLNESNFLACLRWHRCPKHMGMMWQGFRYYLPNQKFNNFLWSSNHLLAKSQCINAHKTLLIDSFYLKEKEFFENKTQILLQQINKMVTNMIWVKLMLEAMFQNDESNLQLIRKSPLI